MFLPDQPEMPVTRSQILAAADSSLFLPHQNPHDSDSPSRTDAPDSSSRLRTAACERLHPDSDGGKNEVRKKSVFFPLRPDICVIAEAMTGETLCAQMGPPNRDRKS